MNATRHAFLRDERGQVTAFVAILAAALLLAAGLVYDGGQLLAAGRRATNEAEAAARAGAQALDVPAYRATGTVRLDPERARTLADDYLAATGHQHTVHLLGDDQIEVTVTVTQQLTMLRLTGQSARTLTGTAAARAVPGAQP
jgi:Flp pilus assembly protein TadG